MNCYTHLRINYGFSSTTFLVTSSFQCIELLQNDRPEWLWDCERHAEDEDKVYFSGISLIEVNLFLSRLVILQTAPTAESSRTSEFRNRNEQINEVLERTPRGSLFNQRRNDGKDSYSELDI